MSIHTHIILITLMAIGSLAPIFVRADEKPQPPVFLWTYGDFHSSAEDSTGLSLSLSYCGKDRSDLSLPALNVAGNVELQITERPTPFTLLQSTDNDREHIKIAVPARSLPEDQRKPFKIQWLVGDMKSNVLVADHSKRTIESTTLYPTTPRPEELQGVDEISYHDDNWTEKTETIFLDKNREISFNFNGDGPKPWRFRYWSRAYVDGVKGEKATLETGRSLEGDVSNDEVLEVWNKLRELGIPMPSWRDSPKSEAGQKWDWFFFTNTDGKLVFTERDEEYYKVARRLEFPLKIKFGHNNMGLESLCEYTAARDSKMWNSITEVFANNSNRKGDDASFKKEITLLETQGDDQACVDVSLQELLANPKKYHGKRVRVSGYHHSELEQCSLSVAPDSIKKLKKSVWLGGMSHFARPEDVPAVNLNDTFITVEGIFTAGPSGHLGAWAGEVGRLTKIQTRITKHAGAAQPATKPADKHPPKVRPSAPTSKDASP